MTTVERVALTTWARRGGPGAEGFFSLILGTRAGYGGAGTSTLGSGTGGLGIDTLDSSPGLRGLYVGGVVLARFKVLAILV